MKKILTSAIAILLFVGASQAQTTTENDHQRGHGKEMMKGMNLTDAQKTQLKTIREAQKKDIDALKAKGDVTPEQRKALHEKYRSQLDAVFTPEQREQMKAKMSDRKAEGGDKGGRGFGGRAPFMNKELNLTSDQQTKLKGYAEDFHAKAKDIRANNSLTDAQKKEQVRNLSKTYMDQSKAVLTADQLKKMQEMRPKHKGRGAANT